MNNPGSKPTLRQHLAMWWHDWNWGTVVIAVIATLYGIWAIYGQSEPHKHDGYEIAQVIVTHDTSSDSGFSVAAQVELKDGTAIMVTTSSLVTANELLDRVCLERRRTVSGVLHYKIVRWTYCDQEGS